MGVQRPEHGRESPAVDRRGGINGIRKAPVEQSEDLDEALGCPLQLGGVLGARGSRSEPRQRRQEQSDTRLARSRSHLKLIILQRAVCRPFRGLQSRVVLTGDETAEIS